MEVLAFCGALIPFLLLLFQEFFSAQARARAANEKFVVDAAALKLILDSAVTKWVARNAKDSVGQGDAWDNADKDAAGPSSPTRSYECKTRPPDPCMCEDKKHI